MSINLSSVCVSGDSNEKDKDRVELIQKFIESNGGYFERTALKQCSTRSECLDYLCEGEFNGKPIDLAIEYKTLTDLSGSIDELEDRLPRALLAHKDVALIIEMDLNDLVELENYNCRFKNPCVKEGKADCLSYLKFQNKIEEWTIGGIHVRVIPSTVQLTTTLISLFYFVTKDSHIGMWLKDKAFESQYISYLANAPIQKNGFSVAKKLSVRFPNMHWLASSSEEDIQDCIGKILGSRWYNFLHNQTLRQNQNIPIIIPDMDKVMSDAKESLPKDPIKPKKPEINVKVPEPIKEPVKTNPDKPTNSPIIDDLIEKVNSVAWANKPTQIKEKSIEQKIIDEVYVMPRSDNYILSMIMSDQKITMAEAHKLMKQTIKESRQLHLSNGMISYNGIKATPEMDIGV